jgi:hypothetical protein
MPSYQIINALDPSRAESIAIDHFFSKSSSHRPQTTVQVCHDDDWIRTRFTVADRFVRAVSKRYHDRIWCDSCVEFFVKPREDKGYFNFEFSANGQYLISYITDPARVPGGFKEFVKVPWDLAKQVEVKSSLGSSNLDPEIQEPVMWTLDAAIPVSLMEHFAGPLRPLAGQRWRGNFYKCGDETSHPHWGAWSPVTRGESFHQPEFFGELIFAG